MIRVLLTFVSVGLLLTWTIRAHRALEAATAAHDAARARTAPVMLVSPAGAFLSTDPVKARAAFAASLADQAALAEVRLSLEPAAAPTPDPDGIVRLHLIARATEARMRAFIIGIAQARVQPGWLEWSIVPEAGDRLALRATVAAPWRRR